MSSEGTLSTIGQIAVTVSDVATALAFYRDALGLTFLFGAGPNLAFLNADGVRIMLSTPQGAGSVGHNSILYFKVRDIVAVHAAVVGRGAVSERAPRLAAKLPGHELWTGFLRDPDGNLVGLMEEKTVGPALPMPVADSQSPRRERPAPATRPETAKRASSDGWMHWFLQPPEGAARALPGWARALNFLAALGLIAAALYWPFTQLGITWNWAAVYRYREKFLQGYELTAVIATASLVLSVLFGILSALAGRARLLPLRYANRIYVDLVRGTPLLVQILILYYVTANAIGISDRNVAGVLILSFSYGAYISEVIRAGIENIGKTQLDSAKAIGLTTTQTYRYVIFPQALRQILPSLAGQLVSLIKDSALLSIISVSEFTKNAEEAGNITFSVLECYLVLAVGYLILTLPISFLTRYLEGRSRFET